MKKLPVIIDCDPGHDDALMLMLAFGSGLFDVKAVTTSAGNPITMCGLDVTHKAVVFQKDIDLFRAIGNKTGEAAANILEFYSKFYRENRVELEGGAALHDPCAIAWLINPDMFKTKPCYVAVETKGELTSGATVVDFYNVLKKTPNAEVAYDINREEYIKMLEDAIRNLP
ncbi:nucleoside hydrolase [Dyadobacter diqingensis]|uniref:nucleoside hydrolase n=1 Tax=Dyadobacter diqingensis TaxID=2938121 RepID=UPI0020C39086|nr:nucleoside hydrolase [Dyadobacter diqingensis]